MPPAQLAATRAAMLRILSKHRANCKAVASEAPNVDPQGCDLEGIHVEHCAIATETGEKCPVYLVRRTDDIGRPLRPVFYLHGTNGSKHQMLQQGHLQRIARMGLVAVGIDSRCHG